MLIRSSKNQKGASIVEYALLVGLIAIVAIIAISATGDSSKDTFEEAGLAVGSGGSGVTISSTPASASNVLGSITVDYGAGPTGPSISYLATCVSQADASSISNETSSPQVTINGLNDGETYDCLISQIDSGSTVETRAAPPLATASPDCSGKQGAGIEVWATCKTYYPGDLIEFGWQGAAASTDNLVIMPAGGNPTASLDHYVVSQGVGGQTPAGSFIIGKTAGTLTGDTLRANVWSLPPGNYNIALITSGFSNRVTPANFTILESNTYDGPTVAEVSNGTWTSQPSYVTGDTIEVNFFALVSATDSIVITPNASSPSVNVNRWIVSNQLGQSNPDLGGKRILGRTGGGLTPDTLQTNIWSLPPGNYTAWLLSSSLSVRSSVSFTVIPELGYAGPTQAEVITGVWVPSGSVSNGANIPVGFLQNIQAGDRIVVTPASASNVNANVDRYLVSQPLGQTYPNISGIRVLGGNGGQTADTLELNVWPLPTGDYKAWLTNSGVGIKAVNTFTVEP